MDFRLPQGPGAAAAPALDPPPRRMPAVAPVSPVAGAGATGDDARRLPAETAGRDLAARRAEMERRDRQPGPPPAFEMSLLEMDRALAREIARIEAQRARGALAAADAGAPPPPAQGAAAEPAEPGPTAGPDPRADPPGPPAPPAPPR